MSISIPASFSALAGNVTPTFAVARTVGWVAHWNEMIADPETRLFRPRQLYTGPAQRDVVPVNERESHQQLVG